MTNEAFYHYFYKKSKALYPNPKHLFGIVIWIWIWATKIKALTYYARLKAVFFLHFRAFFIRYGFRDLAIESVKSNKNIKNFQILYPPF